MLQTPLLINALKQALKAHGKTYADVAKTLGLSTASVKRLFSEQSLSLKRLDQICALLDMEITDLLQHVADDGWQMKQLSEAQEAAIASDMPLLLITVAVLNRLGPEEIGARFNIDQHQLVRKLAWLDRQGFIDLLPGNRIKLNVASNFAWRPDGPIQRFFQHKLSGEYFRTRFVAEGERLIVLNGLLSKAGVRQFHRVMERIAQEFDELTKAESANASADRAGQTVVLAVRSWAFGAFSEYLR